MKHIHGVSIELLQPNGVSITESLPGKRIESSLVRFNGQVGSRNVCLKPGQSFKVKITIRDKFKFYRAEGVKIVVVANGVYASAPYEEVRQRHDMWWIKEPEQRLGGQQDYVINGFTAWNQRRASQEEHTSFLAPQVVDESSTVTASWIMQEHYCANKGSIAVFVERGHLIEEDNEAGISLGDRSGRASPTPIRYDEFVCLNSNNAIPYVFEFRNVDAAMVHSEPTDGSKSNQAFGGDRGYFSSDRDCVVYDTDHESESEEEAQMTDSSDSESDASALSELDSDCDSDADSAVSVSSRTHPTKRKCKARSPRRHQPQKRAKTKTNAQKNAEADAGNPTFANCNNKNTQWKNADADATNATFGYDCHASTLNDEDRDDEEFALPIKREPTVKKERPESTSFGMVSRASSVAAPALGGRRGGIAISRSEIIDLTLEDSDEDEGRGFDGRRGIGSMQKKWEKVKSGWTFTKSNGGMRSRVG